ncbi:hypothetical protein pb186bvf_002014 [Paramecium bursaria]
MGSCFTKNEDAQELNIQPYLYDNHLEGFQQSDQVAIIIDQDQNVQENQQTRKETPKVSIVPTNFAQETQKSQKIHTSQLFRHKTVQLKRVVNNEQVEENNFFSNIQSQIKLADEQSSPLKFQSSNIKEKFTINKVSLDIKDLITKDQSNEKQLPAQNVEMQQPIQNVSELFKEAQHEESMCIQSDQAIANMDFQPKQKQTIQEVLLQSSKGEKLVFSFAPNQNQFQQYEPVEQHHPPQSKAVPLNMPTVKIDNEYIVQLLNNLEPLDAQSNPNSIQLGPYVFLELGHVYIGEWYKGQRHGFGRQIFYNGEYYEGQWKNDQLDGYGRFIHKNGDYYQGEFEGGIKKGLGTFTYHDDSYYEGEWSNNLKNGRGKEQTANGTVYIGDFRNGIRHGIGRLENTDGSLFEGSFSNGKIHGEGEFIWPDGKRYKGDWVEGMMQGHGEFVWVEGKKYVGQYHQNVRQGYGEYQWPDGRTYKGFWFNGMMEGNGILILPNQQRVKGVWKQGEKQMDKKELEADKKKKAKSKTSKQSKSTSKIMQQQPKANSKSQSKIGDSQIQKK